MKKVSISIVVPVYNVEPYVERCLRSVITQTYDGTMECVVVDDCGTDNSIEVVRKVVSEYAGPITFKIIHHKWNRGLSAARNTGIDAASCDYILFLDSDDALLPDSLERLAKPIHNDRTIDMVMGNRALVSNPSVPFLTLCETDLFPLESVRNYLLTHSVSVAAWNKLTNRDFLKTNRLYFKDGLFHEDLLWTHYVMKYLHHFYIIPDITYLICWNPDSITQGRDKEELARHKGMIYEEIATNLTKGEEAKETMHYFPGFCSLFCRYPYIQSYQKSALLFKQALSDGHHRSVRIVLSVMGSLSKSALGRWLLSIGIKARRRIHPT